MTHCPALHCEESGICMDLQAADFQVSNCTSRRNRVGVLVFPGVEGSAAQAQRMTLQNVRCSGNQSAGLVIGCGCGILKDCESVHNGEPFKCVEGGRWKLEGRTLSEF